jgi:F-type H+-transporting ATPase subunit delta
MKLTSAQYAQALYLAVHETKDHETVLNNFVKVLSQNGDLGKYSEIEKEYTKLTLKAQGIAEVNITFAQEHNTKILDDLNKVVKSQTKFTTKIDNQILGGVIVKVDDTLIDASIKTQLINLNSQLKS